MDVIPVPEFILERITPDGWIKADALLGIFSSVQEARYDNRPLNEEEMAECWRQALDIASEMVREATAQERVA